MTVDDDIRKGFLFDFFLSKKSFGAENCNNARAILWWKSHPAFFAALCTRRKKAFLCECTLQQHQKVGALTTKSLFDSSLSLSLTPSLSQKFYMFLCSKELLNWKREKVVDPLPCVNELRPLSKASFNIISWWPSLLGLLVWRTYFSKSRQEKTTWTEKINQDISPQNSPENNRNTKSRETKK